MKWDTYFLTLKTTGRKGVNCYLDTEIAEFWGHGGGQDEKDIIREVVIVGIEGGERPEERHRPPETRQSEDGGPRPEVVLDVEHADRPTTGATKRL